jgi:hypothetical protein
VIPFYSCTAISCSSAAPEPGLGLSYQPSGGIGSLSQSWPDFADKVMEIPGLRRSLLGHDAMRSPASIPQSLLASLARRSIAGYRGRTFRSKRQAPATHTLSQAPIGDRKRTVLVSTPNDLGLSFISGQSTAERKPLPRSRQQHSKSAPVPSDIRSRKKPPARRPITALSPSISLTIGPGPVP